MDLFPHLRKNVVKGPINPSYCHKTECQSCPLALEPNVFLDMPPTGAERPLAYVIAEAPGADEAESGVQLVGRSGQLWRSMVPSKFKDRLRYNNTVKCQPAKNATPSVQAIECCRPRTSKDIARTKPKAIIGLGLVPLIWALPFGSDFTSIKLWRGRRLPVSIEGHLCWYYPLLHPALLKVEEERITRLDVQRIFTELEDLEPPGPIPDVKAVFENIDLIWSSAGVTLVEKWFEWALKQSEVGLDFETNQLRPYSSDARVLTFSIATAKKGFSVALDHPDSGWNVKERKTIKGLFVDFLRKYKGRVYVHNLAFDLEWTCVYFEDISLARQCDWHDTMSQAAIIDERKGETKPGPFSLEFLVQQYFGFNLKKITQLNKANLAAEPLEIVLRYNGGDARYHCRLGIEQRKIIEWEGLQEAYHLALRRVPTVVLTQIKGVPVDKKEVLNLKDKYESRLNQLDEELAKIEVVRAYKKERGIDFSPLSPKEVLYVFKDMLDLAECKIYDKKKREERFSVDKNVLETLDHPLARKIVEYRESTKRLSTYILPLLPDYKDTVIHSDGLVHASFNTVFAETGRLSADSPNLQSYPKRDSEAKELRRQMVALKGCVAVALDYGQIEARVIAMATKDKRFVQMLWEDYDVHMEWAERVAHAYPARIGGKKNLSDKKVMKELRTDIKNQWTFPLFFGAKLSSVAGYLGIPENVIEPLFNEFWRQFSVARDWQEDTIDFYQAHGYVECLTGRRRHGPMTVNQLINAPIQGSAAEIVMDAMARLSETGDLELQPEINIHDDLTYLRVPEDRAEEICEKIVDKMIHVPFKWAQIVPITVEMSVGRNWMPYDKEINPEGLKEIATYRSDKW